MAYVDSLTKVADKLAVTTNTKGKALQLDAFDHSGYVTDLGLKVFFDKAAEADFQVVIKVGDTEVGATKEILSTTVDKDLCLQGETLNIGLPNTKAKFAAFEFSGASTVTAWVG